ncbi:MAG: hypothetical protein ACI9E5_000424 [Candidatus Omnitrophota bacterium]|jgi:hypothetical protein
MMINNLIKIILLLLISSASSAEAVIRNPFIPQLPADPVIIEPIKTAPARIEPQQPIYSNNFTRVRPPVIAKEPVVFPSFEFTGIIWNTNMPQAIINNTIVKEGDVINEVTISSIKQNAIEMQYKGDTKTVEP